MKLFLIGFLLTTSAFAEWGIVENVCREMNYKDCNLVKAMVMIESGNDPNAIGHDGAGSLGLMQVRCSTAWVLDKIHGRKKIKCSELFNPRVNVSYGIEYLNYIGSRLTKKPNMSELLSVYNGGYFYNEKKSTYEVKICNSISVLKKRKCIKGIEPFNVEYSKKVMKEYQNFVENNNGI